MPDGAMHTLRMARKEIRLRWDPEVVDRKGDPDGCGQWQPNTLENLLALKVIVAGGNEVFGGGSYWIEQRGVIPHRSR